MKTVIEKYRIQFIRNNQDLAVLSKKVMEEILERFKGDISLERCKRLLQYEINNFAHKDRLLIDKNKVTFFIKNFFEDIYKYKVHEYIKYDSNRFKTTVDY